MNRPILCTPIPSPTESPATNWCAHFAFNSYTTTRVHRGIKTNKKMHSHGRTHGHDPAFSSHEKSCIPMLMPDMLLLKRKTTILFPHDICATIHSLLCPRVHIQCFCFTQCHCRSPTDTLNGETRPLIYAYLIYMYCQRYSYR